MTTNRPLRVFLCHSSNDKPAVRELYLKLLAETWIQPWLDEEELYPGQDWNLEIEKAVEVADAILVCLTKSSLTKEGYVQRELRSVLDFADYKPEGTLYIIPVRLEECDPPRRLRAWQYADYFEGQRDRAFQRLLVSLRRRADSLELKFESPNFEEKIDDGKWLEKVSTEYRKRFGGTDVGPTGVIIEPSESGDKLNGESVESKSRPNEIAPNKITLSNGMELMRVPKGGFVMGSTKEDKLAFDYEFPQHTVDIPYDYFMARFPLTNELYNAYCNYKGIKHPVNGWEKKKDHPVTNVNWIDAMGYCQWLNSLFRNELPSGLILRLPTEAEWEKAARGTDGRECPWGNEFDKNKCNSYEGGKDSTTSVGFYSPHGDSPYGCVDMMGNILEWTHSRMKEYPYKVNDGREDESAFGSRVLRGGSFYYDVWYNRCASRLNFDIPYLHYSVGFRVVASPDLS